MHEAIHYLVIDGVPSTDFGVYVTNSGAYTVPKKDYDLKAVSGRNGALYLDYGRMENVEIEYSGFIYENFQENFDGFMAFLMSRQGYFRLEDTVREDIYREAVFVGEVKPKVQPEGTMGTFEITFDCKPQKFLKSGEEPVEITPPTDGLIWVSFGAYINNPTLFSSSPLVQVYGSGNLSINDYTINVQNNVYGMINVVDPERMTAQVPVTAYYKPWLYNHGDYALVHARWWVKFKLQNGTATRAELRGASGECTQDVVIDADGVVTVGTYLDEEFSFYQMGSTNNLELTSSVRVYYRTGSSQESYQDVTVTEYIAEVGDERITLSVLSLSGNVTYIKETKQVDSVMVNSTVPSLGNPLNIDMETGDAYKIENGQKVYVNNAVWVGEKLAVLEPGENRILAEDTMSKVVFIPRWWTV